MDALDKFGTVLQYIFTKLKGLTSVSSKKGKETKPSISQNKKNYFIKLLLLSTFCTLNHMATVGIYQLIPPNSAFSK